MTIADFGGDAFRTLPVKATGATAVSARQGDVCLGEEGIDRGGDICLGGTCGVAGGVTVVTGKKALGETVVRGERGGVISRLVLGVVARQPI